ncbi:MAG: prepilin-type N-terminal cleavage/methylation domain-containing protein [Deltaproteobacteria bacterium]|jgi:prepilin-type N-terminal cleavage/methylation domain-containing protein|nr:prepilin-type N-terminal cleavage/methylation domain-containing protein [Deltaproteobacteria bacterium]
MTDRGLFGKTVSFRAQAREPQGFTLFELLVVIGLIGALAALSFSSFRNLLPQQTVRSEAERFFSLVDKAKTMAASGRLPVRAIIDCSSKGGVACAMTRQQAVVQNLKLVGWEKAGAPIQGLSPQVMVDNSLLTQTDFDGNRSITGIYWVIFMPDGRVYSDPKPFDVFFFQRSQRDQKNQNPVPGWRMTINQDNGSINMSQESRRIKIT